MTVALLGYPPALVAAFFGVLLVSLAIVLFALLADY